MSDFDSLLPDLDQNFGEPAAWLGNPLMARFIMDYTPLSLPVTDQGMTQSQTWAYFGRWQLPPGAGSPKMHDIFMIHGRSWEIVEIGEDDLEEVQMRLLPYQASPLDEFQRGPGRPSQRERVLATYDALVAARMIDPSRPLSHAFGPIRRRLTGIATATPGFSDKTLQVILSGRSSSGAGAATAGVLPENQ